MSENLDITTFLLSETKPHQGASANAKASGYYEGDFVTVFKCNDRFGYCFHGVGAGGNAYESEDVTGFASAEEAFEDAQASYAAEKEAAQESLT